MNRYNIHINRLFLIVILIAGITVSCEEKNDYDYNKIIPKIVGGINGPSEILATGAKAEVFKVINRGGSTWSWQVIGSDATITQDPNFGSIADITFAPSTLDKTAQVIVTETTQGGLTASDTLNVELLAFQKLTWDDFVGTWTGTEEDDTEVSFEVVKGDTENSIVIKAEAGIPGLFGGVYTSWGESFQPDFGNEGDVIAVIDLNTGDVTIEGQYFGQTLPGPYDYYIYGAGTYNGYMMKLTYSMNFDDTFSDDYAVYTTVFTKSE